MRCGVPIVPNGEPCDREAGHQGPHIRATVIGETPTGEQVRFIPQAQDAGRCPYEQTRVAALNQPGVAARYRCIRIEGHAGEHDLAYAGEPQIVIVPPDLAREQRERHADCECGRSFNEHRGLNGEAHRGGAGEPGDDGYCPRYRGHEGVRPERERSARESLRMIAAELDQADGETFADVHERVRRITGAALAHYASDFEPWQPEALHVALLQRVVREFGGVLLVTRYDVHYLASDEGRRIKALPFADGTVSVEVDDG